MASRDPAPLPIGPLAACLLLLALAFHNNLEVWSSGLAQPSVGLLAWSLPWDLAFFGSALLGGPLYRLGKRLVSPGPALWICFYACHGVGPLAMALFRQGWAMLQHPELVGWAWGLVGLQCLWLPPIVWILEAAGAHQVASHRAEALLDRDLGESARDQVALMTLLARRRTEVLEEVDSLLRPKLQALLAPDAWPEGPHAGPAWQALLDQVDHLASQEARAMSHRLHPGALRWGLEEALRVLAEAPGGSWALRWDSCPHPEAPLQRLTKEQALAWHRLVEALAHAWGQAGHPPGEAAFRLCWAGPGRWCLCWRVPPDQAQEAWLQEPLLQARLAMVGAQPDHRLEAGLHRWWVEGPG